MASLFKNSCGKQRFSVHVMMIVSSVLFVFLTFSDSYSQEPLDSDIAKALKKVVKCEKIEVKTKTENNKGGKLKTLLIRFIGLPKHILPADYVTVQYTNPDIDLISLKKSNNFKVKSSSNFKIGMLVSEQTIQNEFKKTAKRLNFTDYKLSIKFTPPYIELEFDVPVTAIPQKDRKLVEKFIKNKRLEGYATLRLEIHDNKIIASPVKVILNHFLVPMPLVSEFKKRINPIYQIPRMKPFDYRLVKVDLLKQHIFFSN